MTNFFYSNFEEWKIGRTGSSIGFMRLWYCGYFLFVIVLICFVIIAPLIFSRYGRINKVRLRSGHTFCTTTCVPIKSVNKYWTPRESNEIFNVYRLQHRLNSNIKRSLLLTTWHSHLITIVDRLPETSIYKQNFMACLLTLTKKWLKQLGYRSMS